MNIDRKLETTIYDHHNGPVFFQAEHGAEVTKSDSTVLQAGVLYIGTGGDVNVVTRGGSTLLFVNVADASFLPVVVVQVLSTDTTASDMLIIR
jgi:hypothetical protein